jgi:hypothetical protein
MEHIEVMSPKDLDLPLSILSADEEVRENSETAWSSLTCCYPYSYYSYYPTSSLEVRDDD